MLVVLVFSLNLLTNSCKVAFILSVGTYLKLYIPQLLDAKNAIHLIIRILLMQTCQSRLMLRFSWAGTVFNFLMFLQVCFCFASIQKILQERSDWYFSLPHSKHSISLGFEMTQVIIHGTAPDPLLEYCCLSLVNPLGQASLHCTTLAIPYVNIR